ncbi:hypothetical protein GWI33_010899 [Rhynchophorus ferrugineus]|uniref:Uncharacterized protein n=1 Tax=Rhynchophorus ferrugineus TaxID=354439 RepID=A0A834I7X7_RHYFE|nr:hypothetical protein GWI33_010899 [Rhynchophorus ferrugineus]
MTENAVAYKRGGLDKTPKTIKKIHKIVLNDRKVKLRRTARPPADLVGEEGGWNDARGRSKRGKRNELIFRRIV